MALKSALLSGDPKLEKAAVSDADHILPGDRGPHVLKIQQALIDVAGATITPDSVYGPATAAAVAEFKRTQSPPILNYAGKIDNIVGIKTLAALDAHLPRAGGGGLNLDFIFGATLVDVVINFIGAPAEREVDPDRALPQSMLVPSYELVEPSSPKKLMRRKADDQLLVRIAQETTEFGLRGAAMLARVMVSLQQTLQGKDPANENALFPDKIFVLGSSSGGRNAIDFAGMLAQVGQTPRFVAAIDASFTQANTDTRPRDNPQTVLPTPLFKLTRITNPAAAASVLSIPSRHNFFQTQGNHRGDSINPFADPFFTSNMSGGLGEIHGDVESFVRHQIFFSTTFPKTDDELHELACPQGRLEAQTMIAAELKGVPSPSK